MNDWITDGTWKATEERRAVKHWCSRETNSTKMEELRQEHKQNNGAVKEKTKRNRKTNIHEGHRPTTGLKMIPGRP